MVAGSPQKEPLKEQRKQSSNDDKKKELNPKKQQQRQDLDTAILTSVEELHIEQKKTVNNGVPSEPYALPTGLNWSTCDMNDPEVVDEVYHLLHTNYTRDEQSQFHFHYSRPYLRWVLQPPGYNKDWHVGVRDSSQKLIGFIAGIPVQLTLYDKESKMAEINFLCVHQKYWGAVLDPVLVKEITRRINLARITQAIFTSTTELPDSTTRITRSKFYHRPLNPTKLTELKFSRALVDMDEAKMKEFFKLPSETQVPGLRPFEQKDVPACCKMLSNYLEKFLLKLKFTEEEFTHWFTPQDDVISTYVVEDPETHEITDMFAFYTLSCSVMRHEKYKEIKSAYLYYNVSTKTPRTKMITDALVLVKQRGFDIFHALGVMENGSFFKDLKFTPGNGYLQYYLYNEKCKNMAPRDVGMIIL